MQNFSEYGVRNRFLTKDEELALGAKVQHYLRVKDRWEAGNLSYEERRSLYPIIREGEKAVTTLVESNIGLVKSRAKTYKSKFPSAPPMEDLIQEGMAGLMNAVWKYDPQRGNKFSTVAHYWIMQAIHRGVNKTGRLVRLPENRISNLTHMMKLTASEEAQGLTAQELDAYIMKELNISKGDLTNIRDAASTPASLNKVVGSDSDGGKELLDFVAVRHTQASSEDEALGEEMKAVLLEAVTTLDEVAQAIILSQYPLLPTTETPEEVRARYNLQPLRFKKLQAQAYEQLKNTLSAKGYSLNDFLSGN